MLTCTECELTHGPQLTPAKLKTATHKAEQHKGEYPRTFFLAPKTPNCFAFALAPLNKSHGSECGKKVPAHVPENKVNETLYW